MHVHWLWSSAGWLDKDIHTNCWVILRDFAQNSRSNWSSSWLPKAWLLGRHFSRWQWIWRGWLRNLPWLCEITPIGRSRSLKVTDFSVDRKPVGDIQLVNNTNLTYLNLRPTSHRFRVIVAHWSSNYRCLCLTQSFGVNTWTMDCEIWPQNN